MSLIIKKSHFRRSWGSCASRRDESWPEGQGYFWHFSISALGLLRKASLLGSSSPLVPQTHGPCDSILPRPRSLRRRQTTAPSFQLGFLSWCSCTLCSPQSLTLLPDFSSTLSPVLPVGVPMPGRTLLVEVHKNQAESLFSFMLFTLLTSFGLLLHLLNSCLPIDYELSAEEMFCIASHPTHQTFNPHPKSCWHIHYLIDTGKQLRFIIKMEVKTK